MPIAGLKSSKWDACRYKAESLEKCMGQNDYDLASCQPQLFDLKNCCKRYRGKSIHCGFDPAVDPPDKHDVPLPDPDEPVEEKPAVFVTLSPGDSELNFAESYTPPVAKSKKPAPGVASTLTYQYGAVHPGEDPQAYLCLETKIKRAISQQLHGHVAAKGSVENEVEDATSSGAVPAAPSAERACAPGAAAEAKVTGEQEKPREPKIVLLPQPKPDPQQAGVLTESERHSQVAGPGPESSAAVPYDESGDDALDSNKAGPGSSDPGEWVPWVPKGTRGYQVIENMIEKKAERIAKKMREE